MAQLQLGDDAPDFTAESTDGPIKFHEYLGSSWGVLFSHPKDFTPVCTTELGRVAALKPEFDKRNVKVLGLSVDSLGSHKEWVGDIKETQGHALNFPLLADPDKHIANLYGMIHPKADNTLTVRSVFVIGPDKKIQLTLTYPASTGRNFDELLRVIDSLQLTANHKVATPVDWKQGDDVIIVPSLNTEDAQKLFPGGWKTVKPYLRIVPQPK
jgi:alkyl hydroperoxide reductase subunit AhpC